MKRQLKCCCCGGNAGSWEQHWNRDKGFGVCLPCVQWAVKKGMTLSEVEQNYGVEGVNYGPPVTLVS